MTQSFNESSLVELPILEKLQSKDWTYVKADQLERESYEEPLLTSQLVRCLRKINLWMGDDDVKQVLNELKLRGAGIEDSKKMLRYFKEGVYVKREKARELRKAHLFDYQTLQNNEFTASRQVVYRRADKEIITDIMLYINGIPIVNIECKNPASFSTSWLDAYKDIKIYEKDVPELYKYVQIGVAAEKDARYFPIVPWGEPKASMWREGEIPSTDALIEMLTPAILLDIVRNYLFYRMEFGQATKVIVRHMQYRASEKIVNRVKAALAKKDEKNRGLIWHWQGSGKTLTMIFAANKLYYERTLENPTIFFMVDRVELEEQIHQEISALDMPSAEVVGSRAQLGRILKHDGGRGKRGLFVVLMHKFQAGDFEELKTELNGQEGETVLTRKNIVAFIDEGHRTQYGLYAAQMKDILRNAFFFAFTGTPISAKEKDTYQSFAYPPDEKYLDKYFMGDSLRDGFTVKIVYQPRLEKEVHLKKEMLENFLEIEDEEIPEEVRADVKEETKKKIRAIDITINNPANIAKIAKDIATHFKENVDGKFKAMVVAGSRKSCVTYKRELDKLLPKEASEVVMTFGGKDDPQEVRDFAKELEKRLGFAESYEINGEMKRKFKEEENPKILIVTDMLLTGFDVPQLQAMYLHKPLKGHRLLQAIARTNRPYKGVKEAGLILDYVGILKDIKRALGVYGKDEGSTAPIESMDELKAEFDSLLDETLGLFSGIKKESNSRKVMDDAIRIITTIRGNPERFVENYKKLRSIYEILGSDPDKIKFYKNYDWLTSIYIYYMKTVLMNEPEAEQYLEKYYAKTLKYVYKTTEVQKLVNDLPTIAFDENYLKALEKKMETKQQKAANVVFTLNRYILVDKKTNPVYETLVGKVERILKMWQEKSADFEAVYREGASIISEWNDLNRRQNELGFSNLEYAILLALEGKISGKVLVEDTKALSKKMEENMFSGWQFQPSAKKAVDREIRLFLRKYVKEGLTLAGLEELHGKIMDCVVSYAKG
ncbi:MAG: HsdR family type I site-specific deoxyribonuclease [Candidatus Micrarchaeia archaeon]